MPKPSTTAKRKYNKLAYRRYEFSVDVDTFLNYILERYAKDSKNSLSALIKNLLANHFGVDQDEIYMPFALKKIDGEWIKIPNNKLDLFFESLSL